MATLNNESEDLNLYRLRHFGLTDIFSTFFSSCWVGALKPKPRIYQLALAMSQADPAAVLFIDDRQSSLDSGARLGMQTVLYTARNDSRRPGRARRGRLRRLRCDWA